MMRIQNIYIIIRERTCEPGETAVTNKYKVSEVMHLSRWLRSPLGLAEQSMAMASQTLI